MRVANPERPLGDLTAEVKRTLSRPKPREEWVTLPVPALVSEELWQRANAILTERGRGRGKGGQSIQALLRGKIYCPRCGKPMLVRRDSRRRRTYYHCAKYFRTWEKQRCTYTRFVPGSWDNLVWDVVCGLLEDDCWLDMRLASKACSDQSSEGLLKLYQSKMRQATTRIARVREGFEGGLYSLEEAKQRIAELEGAVAGAQAEIQRINRENGEDKGPDLEALKRKLAALREANLAQATFEEKWELVSRLGIKVYPAEDLKAVRVSCDLDLRFSDTSGPGAPVECRKVLIGPPLLTKSKTFHATFPWRHKSMKIGVRRLAK